jgi:beta-phosphoglucomutase
VATYGFLFDLDGVLVDTARFHFLAWRRLAHSLGFDFSEVQNEQLKGVSRVESLNKILSWAGQTKTDAEKVLLMDLKNTWYLELVHTMDPDEVLPGARTFLESAKQAGIKIGLGSASKNAQLILDRTRLTPYFDTIVDGNRATLSKPNPQVFAMGAADLGLDPAACLVFEDAPAGVEAALAAGMRAVGIGAPQDLPGAALWVPDLSHLNPNTLLQTLFEA